MKLLAVDIGNTTINFGLFENGNLILKKKIISYGFKNVPIKDYSESIVSSVVPDLTLTIKKTLKNPIILNNKNIPIKIKLKNPSQVGIDRLVNAVAAKNIYSCPSIVIDFGTATTFDIVSEKGEYIGGIIAPGIKISAESLYEKTAKLPKLNIKKINNLKIIGKNTNEAINSGIIYGHIGLIKEVLREIEKQNPKIKKPKIILTGGYSKMLSGFFDFKIDEELTLKGLQVIFDSLKVSQK
ncbi:MAG TPA: type III pantothenate kinase [Elusimicrobia bacterium]|nr:type III pantothenate kinase [Elusimicrobiota bacterium]